MKINQESINKFHQDVTLTVDAFFLGEGAQNARIIKCIEMHSGFNRNIFTRILYKVTQLFLSIFGRSDWQYAVTDGIQLFKNKEDSIIDSQQITLESQWKYLSNRIIAAHVKYYQFITKNFNKFEENEHTDFDNQVNKLDALNYQQLFRGISDDFSKKYQRNLPNALSVFKPLQESTMVSKEFQSI